MGTEGFVEVRRGRSLVVPMALALFLGACSSADKGPDDLAIKSGIQSKLFEDATFKTRDIRVDSAKGVVTLTGTVASDTEKLAVEGLTRQVPGVTQVINQLAVSAPPPTQAPQPAETAASNPPPEKPRKAKHVRRQEASSEADQASAPVAAALVPVQAAPTPAVQPAPVQTVAQTTAPTPAAPPPPPPPVTVEVPSGTVISVRMIDSIDSSVNRAGEEFAASLEAPVVVGDKVVIQRGADARVRLNQVSSAGHVQGRSELQLELVSLTANGTTYNVTSGYYEQQGASRGKRTAATMGGASGLGALIGAIAGGGKGAAIGAGIGAAGGGVATAATKGQQVKVPAETKLDFTLKSPFTVTLKPTATS
jgi:BON domain